jgi:hypothetical protein
LMRDAKKLDKKSKAIKKNTKKKLKKNWKKFKDSLMNN